jgi:hypothetical protein
MSFVREFNNYLAGAGVDRKKAHKCVALLISCLERDSSAHVFMDEWVQAKTDAGAAYTLDEAVQDLIQRFWTTTIQEQEHMSAHGIVMSEQEPVELFVQRFQKARRLADAAAIALQRTARSGREWADVFVNNLRPTLRQQMQNFLKLSAADKSSHPQGYIYDLDQVCRMAVVYGTPAGISKKRSRDADDQEHAAASNARAIKMAVAAELLRQNDGIRNLQGKDENFPNSQYFNASYGHVTQPGMYAPAMPFHYPSHVMAPAMYGQHAPAPTDNNTQHLTNLAADMKATLDKLEQKEASKRGQETQSVQDALAELRKELRENKLAMFQQHTPQNNFRKGIVCFSCGQPGHTKTNCPGDQQGAGHAQSGAQRPLQNNTNQVRQGQIQPSNPPCVVCRTYCGATGPWECTNACRSCGGQRHKPSNCPAINSLCERCNRTGHYTNVCLRHMARPAQPMRPAMQQGQRAPMRQPPAMQQPPTMQQQYGAQYGPQPVHAHQQAVHPMMMAPAQPFMQQHTPPAFNPNAAAQGPYMDPTRASMIQANMGGAR